MVHDGDGDGLMVYVFRFPPETSLRPSSPPSADASVNPSNEAFIQNYPDDSDASDASFGSKHHPAVGKITDGKYHGPEHCWARKVLHNKNQMSP